MWKMSERKYIIKKKSKGMTLIEVLFSTAIFSFLAITLFALFKLGQTYWSKGMAYNTLQAEGKRILTLLQQDIKESDINKDLGYSYQTSVSNIFVGNQRVSRDGLLLSVPNPNYRGGAGEYPVIYRAYIATSEINNNQGGTGSLYLLEFNPTSATGYDRTWSNIDSNLRNLFFQDGFSKNELNSLDNPRPIEVSLLSNNLFSFKANRSTNTISISVVLVKKSFSDQKLQSVRFELEIVPANNDLFPFNN
jgi:prepilin-type N-terminal cleavage/methylation domain-containing protein